MKFLPSYLIAALLLAGCGNQAESGNNKSANESITLAGQVFVVTMGKANIKLALVEVSVIPEKDIVDYLKAKHSNGLEQQKVLMPELDLAKEAANSSSIASARANQEHELALTRLYAATSMGEAAFNRAMRAETVTSEKKDNLLSIADSKARAYREIKSKFDYFDSAEYYFKGLPTSIAISKTDADGKFVLSLPPGKYAIAATSSRKVFKDTESYYWLIWVEASSPNQ